MRITENKHQSIKPEPTDIITLNVNAVNVCNWRTEIFRLEFLKWTNTQLYPTSIKCFLYMKRKLREGWLKRIYIIPNQKKIGVVRFQNMKILPTIKSSFYHDRIHKRYNPRHVYNKTL